MSPERELERLSPTPEAHLPKNSTHPASIAPESAQASFSSSKPNKKARTKQPPNVVAIRRKSLEKRRMS